MDLDKGTPTFPLTSLQNHAKQTKDRKIYLPDGPEVTCSLTDCAAIFLPEA